MDARHSSDCKTTQAAVFVTSMEDARIFHRLTDALFADVSVAKQNRIGAKQTIISKRLHDRHLVFSCRRVHGRRQKREKILNVHYVEGALTKFAVNERVGRSRPDRL